MIELPQIVVGHRGDALRSRFTGIDALIVSDLTNLRWLTGFTGSNGIGVVLDDQIVVVTDGRYGEQAERQMAMAGCTGAVRVGRTSAELLDLLAQVVASTRRVGFESAHTSHQRFVQFGDAVQGELVPTVGLIESGRRRKDTAEIARIERACAIADAALAATVPMIAPGSTEIDIRNSLEQVMRELGAAGPSYETIVATGPVNAPLPHHRPTTTAVEGGHTVIIDVGALVDGYHSDMTRSFLVGEPTALQRQVYDVVLEAQCAGVAAVRPGLTTSALDAVCRDHITEAGFGPSFIHGTGHGVGLLIHEDPFVNSAGTLELQVGDVVTVEPGVYRGDFGGVRVEDLVEVTSNGCRGTHRLAQGRPMPAISTNDLKNGITLQLDIGLFQVVEFQHVKPGKGSAFVRSKLRNLKTGNILERTFNAGVRVEQALLDKKDMQFLYRDGDEYVFMDNESYDQMNVAPVALGDAADYLVEQAVATIAFYNGEIVTVEIPASVELTIADTEPGIQGDRVSGARKSATLETGKLLQVPLFINVGDRVKVDTRSGDYITRV